MLAALRAHLTDWLSQPRTPESGAIDLTQRRVYILPTRYGFTFAVVLVMMLLGSINYGLSLGFVLTFLLVALAFNAMLYTFRNLGRLSVTAARVQPVFAGESATFSLNLFNPSRHDRYAIGLARSRHADSACEFTDVPAGATARITLSVPSKRRGLLPAGRLTLMTQFPLGIYRAWSYIHPDVYCVVYPRPAPHGLPLPQTGVAPGIGKRHGLGQEDFAGLRSYHLGDPPRHIAWKAAARGQGWMTKQFSGEAAREVWLTWDQLPPHLELEEKLSRLARWILDAQAQNLAYGLRLPGLEFPISSGDAHRNRCLEALALFEMPSDSQ